MKIKKHITALATAAALSATLPAVAQQSQHMAPETMLSLARVGASALSPDGKMVVYSVGFPSIKDNKIKIAFKDLGQAVGRFISHYDICRSKALHVFY